MAVEFTEDQKKVINTTDCNILVSAAAGSGKTQVLTQRILRTISDLEHPVDVDHMLVVTFTEAAAAEMRERIAKAISERLIEEPENSHLARQSVLIHRAFITTIDSFCKYVVDNHFGEIGIDPGMRVLDQGEQELIMQQVLTDMFEEYYNMEDGDESGREKREHFIYCVEAMSDKGDDSALKGLILKIYNSTQSFPWPNEWLQKAVSDYSSSSMGESAWLEYLLEDAKMVLDGVQKYETCSYNLASADAELSVMADFLSKELEEIESIANMPLSDDRMEAYRELSYRIRSYKFETLKSGKNLSDAAKAQKELAKGYRDAAKSAFTDLAKDYFASTPEQLVAQMEATGHLMRLIVELVIEFDRRFAAEKLEQGVMDFSDMEHFALDILVKRENGQSIPTDTARELSDWFHEIMTDEYQDSNSVQEEILGAISGEYRDVHNRFMVGDVKQSIYRFRKARPQIILDKMHSYTLDGDINRRIDLKKNFRSRSQVLDVVNDVFEVTMRPAVGGVVYDESARLYLGADYYHVDDDTASMHRPELIYMNLPKTDKDTVRSKQAEYVADLVEQYVGKLLVSGSEVDGNGKKILRPARYSDIAVLFRSVKNNASSMTEAFSKKQIPLHINVKGGYYATTEVAQIIDYLRVLDNPRQDIPLFTVMVSPMGGFTDAQVAQIKVQSDGDCLFDKIKSYATSGAADSMLRDKAIDFLEGIKKYRELATTESVQHIIGKIFDDTNYLSFVEAMPDGIARRANAELLLQKAGSFEENGGGSIFSFIKRVEHMQLANKDEEETGIVDANADVVRVFSIHGSKGLEYPICIIADVCDGINKRDSSESFLIDMDLGVAIKRRDPIARVKSDTLLHKVIARKNDVDTNGEELRLLYVAMTRAKEKLVMIGAESTTHDIMSEWETAWDSFSQGVPDMDIANAKGYMDFIMMGFAKHKSDISVVTVESLEDIEIDETIEATKRYVSVIDPSPDMLGKTELVDVLNKQFEMKYAHPQLAMVKSKWSVSELKAVDYEAALEREAKLSELDSAAESDAGFASAEDIQQGASMHGEPKSYIPSFARKQEDAKPAGTDYGTAHHRIMELLDFSEATSQESIRAQVADFASRGLIPESYADIISYYKVERFVKSELGQRMARAQKAGVLRNEQQFFLGVPADTVDPDMPADETVLIQGIIDAFWEEDGEIVILDYKTDSVKEVSELLDRYATQMRYYAKAVAAGTGKTVKEALFYSFKLDEAVAL